MGYVGRGRTKDTTVKADDFDFGLIQRQYIMHLLSAISLVMNPSVLLLLLVLLLSKKCHFTT